MCASEGKIMKSRWKESKSKSENEGDSDFGLKIGKKDNAFCVAKGIGVSNSTKGEVKVKSEREIKN